MHFRFVLPLACALACLLAVGAFADDRGKVEKKIASLMEKLRSQEAKLLSVSDADKATHASFLSQPDTGITRLMPREKYDGFLLTRGGGAYFSFVRLVHEYGFGSDIELQQESFSVGFAGADFGFLTNLGNTPLDGVTLESAGVQFLSSFVAPTKLPDAREQQHRTGAGFETNGFAYKSNIPAAVNTTYALRSISYRFSDLLVAVRPIRKDSDGSMVFLWKILKRFPNPVLED
ncbi:MAG TPA: hypothetical protein VLR90_19185 [Blastocatellia bacterium]|nr:hypothetical protein [Blastocatellia bacterium]